MGDPGLLQTSPDISPLLPPASGDREQSAAADRTRAGLDVLAVARQIPDLALNHRLAQGRLGGVVGGFDALELEASPEPIGHWQHPCFDPCLEELIRQDRAR